MKNLMGMAIAISLFSFSASATSIPGPRTIGPIVGPGGHGNKLLAQSAKLVKVTRNLALAARKEVKQFPAFHPLMQQRQKKSLKNVLMLARKAQAFRTTVVKAKKGLLLRPKLRIKQSYKTLRLAMINVVHSKNGLFRLNRQFSPAKVKVNYLVQRSKQLVIAIGHRI